MSASCQSKLRYISRAVRARRPILEMISLLSAANYAFCWLGRSRLTQVGELESWKMRTSRMITIDIIHCAAKGVARNRTLS